MHAAAIERGAADRRRQRVRAGAAASTPPSTPEECRGLRLQERWRFEDQDFARLAAHCDVGPVARLACNLARGKVAGLSHFPEEA